jgi:phosphatidylglycerol:prolipoprotein diacylglycerol transferase
MIGPLRMAQIISLGEITLGLLGLAWLYLRRRSFAGCCLR